MTEKDCFEAAEKVLEHREIKAAFAALILVRRGILVLDEKKTVFEKESDPQSSGKVVKQ